MQNTALHARALLEGTPGLYWATIELIYINLELYYHDIDVQLFDQIYSFILLRRALI